jgi:tRNA(Ile)-lysidine synthase
VPRNEAEARAARYAFLERARLQLAAAWTLTAHHADDQAETVLLHLLRGSNPEALSGVEECGEPALVRPLLPFHRHELAAYARDAGTPHREDPSNRSFRFARNRLRHGLWVGDAEVEAAAAKAAALRLAGASRRARHAWARRVERADGRLVRARARGRIVVAAPRLSAYDDATRARLLHRWVRELGGTLGGGGARAARAFLRRATSGATLDLGDGILVRREYEVWIVERRGERDRPERALTIAGPQPGRGDAVIGGRVYRVEWGEAVRGSGARVELDLAEVEFPISVRGWRTGDRLRRSAGRRSLKRLFADRRVPRSVRARLPVVGDARDVLWVPGVERSVRARAVGAATVWSLRVTPVDGRDGEDADFSMER